MNDQPLIIGAGPTGLAAALFLSRKGIPSRIVDQTAEPAKESRAQVVNPRSLELLAPSGVVETMLAEGHAIHRTRFYEGWEMIAEIELGEAHPLYGMTVLPQARTEALLTEALAQDGVHPERGVALETLQQDEAGVSVTLMHADGQRETTRAPILLGADGAHSRVREALGIAFEGSAFPEPWPLYDLQLNDPLDLESAHVSLVKGGLVFLLGLRPGFWRVFADVPDPLDRLPPGTAQGDIGWHSTFQVSHRLAAREASGRVALAGDAAHIHSPVAARGMNLGIEDAYVFAECAAEALQGQGGRLEDFGRMRRQVHRKVIGRIRALTELARGQPDFVGALRRYLLPGMVKFPPTAHPMLRLLTGLDHEVTLC
ncbi:MAG: FAD-dependent monooxygenase [Hyphomicrobiales bacterium]|nr:FAD-dependent monooxygenase [Hyphomicrobiales bacterium]MBV8440648.1 FAD-dependent monooxygenase [Hyphomicrobiales bacterium]